MSDIKESLRDKGLLTLCGKIEEDLIKTATEEILLMNSMEKPEFSSIQLILNSIGGSCWQGFMIVDIIEYSKIPVYITGLGVCASMGILILCSGNKGHRVITKNTVLLSHQVSWGSEGKYHELIADRKQQDIEHEKIIRHYMRHTKLKRKQIQEILLPKSDVWLTPAEAKKYGLVDKVIN
jgi:ATP-dependent Clp protease protease subunit